MDLYRLQHKIDDYIYLAKTRKETCPVALLQLYLEKAGITSAGFIFCGLMEVKAGHKLRKVDKLISYTTLPHNVLTAIARIGLNTKLFGLHSMRRRGATYTANNRVSDCLFKKLGRWASEGAKDAM